jgi:hypothetical protein
MIVLPNPTLSALKRCLDEAGHLSGLQHRQFGEQVGDGGVRKLGLRAVAGDIASAKPANSEASGAATPSAA